MAYDYPPGGAPTLAQLLAAQGLTTPNAADYTTDKAAADAVWTTPDGLAVWSDANAGSAFAGRYNTALPFGAGQRLLARCRMTLSGGTSYAGVLLRETATGEYITFCFRANATIVGYRWTNRATFNADEFVAVSFAASANAFEAWFRIDDDGVNRVYYFSLDSSPNGPPDVTDNSQWILCGTVARTTFLTADRVGFAASGSATAATQGCTCVCTSLQVLPI